jgi:cysteine desulfurase
MNLIYMDHHATTPLDAEVLDAMMPYLTNEYGNSSSSTHDLGRRARLAVENSRAQVAQLVGAQTEEIIITSGATESDNLALKGLAMQRQDTKGRIITLATEHKAILDSAAFLAKQGFEIYYAKLDQYGMVDMEDLEKNITPETFLISMQTANSEIGTIQPIRRIGALARQHHVLFHTDAVQALGRVDVQVDRDNIDMLSISAHKMYGPKGVGALYVRKGLKLTPLIHGGGHERGMRSGTLNVAGIVGMGKAAEMAVRDGEKERTRLLQLRNKLAQGISSKIDQAYLNGHPVERLPNNLNFSFAYVEGESLILACRAVALSSGSACTSSSLQSSYVLRALGVPDSLAHCSIRFGLGKSNTAEHIDFVVDLLAKHVPRLREMSPLYDMAKQGIDIEKFSWGKHDHDHEH